MKTQTRLALTIRWGLLMTLLVPQLSLADPWNTPATLSDSNTTVSFAVDSTFHYVEGHTKGITGRAWLESPSDYRSIRAELSLPVAQFDTDSARRDARMREVLHADTSPAVQVAVAGSDSVCDPDGITAATPCSMALTTKLTINQTTKTMSIPATITRNGDSFIVTGSSSLQWADYGVEDPSILIARLDPTVTINFSITLNPTSNSQPVPESLHAQH